jgi:hypothetical protein
LVAVGGARAGGAGMVAGSGPWLYLQLDRAHVDELAWWACPCWWCSLAADGGVRVGVAHMVGVVVPVLR